ncbi:MAG: hypothetical protein LBH91_05275 [Prevotellaceae bacterium]|nr:hypothetical protein [Prevotellaceae bacterium]
MLAVTSLANTINEAQVLSYQTVAALQYEGIYFRSDIGNDLLNYSAK